MPGQQGRRAAKRPAARNEAASIAAVPQDLVDLIVRCVADKHCLHRLLRLRAVGDAWALAVGTVFGLLFSANEPSAPHRTRLILQRNTCSARLRLVSKTDFDVLRRALPFARDESVRPRRISSPVALHPFASLNRLDFYGSSLEAVNNDTLMAIADRLPALQALGIAFCRGVSDVNMFANHALTELDVTGSPVTDEGMEKLWYIRKLVLGTCKLVLGAYRAAGIATVKRLAGYLTDVRMRWPNDNTLAGIVFPRLHTAHVRVGERFSPGVFNVMPSITDLTISVFGFGNASDPPFLLPPCASLKRLLFECSATADLKPFGNTLTELDVSGHPSRGWTPNPLGNDALEGLRVLTTLRTSGNNAITALGPVADTLTELDACGACGINDQVLQCVRRLRILRVSDNNQVKTIAPFADTLTELHADSKVGNSGLVDADLGVAPNLTYLSVASREDLDRVSDKCLQECKRLKFLDATGNNSITTIAPFAATLERLCGATNISRDSLRLAPHLRDIKY